MTPEQLLALLPEFKKGRLEITPHPLLPNIRRILLLKGGFHWYPYNDCNQIILNWVVSYIDENGLDISNDKLLREYERELKADDTVRVGIDGDVVPKPPNEVQLVEWLSLKTEYEHIVDIADTNTNIFLIMLMTTLKRVEQGKFD